MLVAELEYPADPMTGYKRKATGSGETFFFLTKSVYPCKGTITRFENRLRATVINNAKAKGAIKINIYATTREDFIAGKYYNRLVRTIDLK